MSARGGVRLAELLGGLSIAEDVVNGFPHGKVVRKFAGDRIQKLQFQIGTSF